MTLVVQRMDSYYQILLINVLNSSINLDIKGGFIQWTMALSTPIANTPPQIQCCQSAAVCRLYNDHEQWFGIKVGVPGHEYNTVSV